MSETGPRLIGLFALAVLADVASIASLFGLSGTHKALLVATSTIATLICAGGLAIILRQRRSLVRLAPPLPRVPHLSEAISLLPFATSRTVFCLGSGTETYYSLLEPRMREGLINRGTKICIGYRLGDKEHQTKFAEYGNKWSRAAQRYGLELLFYPVRDFDHSFRGVVLDGTHGAIGFYFREHGETIGGDSEVLLVDKSSDAGSFLLDCFVRVFTCREPVQAMISGDSAI